MRHLLVLTILFSAFVLLHGKETGQTKSISPYFYFPADVFENLEPHPHRLADFSIAYAKFLSEGSFHSWHQDKGWRITAPMVIEVTGFQKNGDPIMTVEYAGTHPVVKVFYSPGVFKWLLNHSKGPIPDGEIIIKQQVYVDPVAKAIISKLKEQGKFPKAGDSVVITKDSVIPATYMESINPAGFPSMIKIASGAFDGWYWGDWGKDHNYPVYGRSAFSTPTPGPQAKNTDANPMPSTPGDNWFNQAPGPPTYPTGNWSGEVVFPMDSFGGYCLNCHASAANDSTFSDFANMTLTDADRNAIKDAGIHIEPTMPFELIVRYQPPEATRALMALVESDGGSHSDLDHDDKPPADHRYTQLKPLDKPHPAFAEAYANFFPDGVTWQAVWDKRFPAQTYDHVVPQNGGNNHNINAFLTSDQCVGCHSAAGMGAPPVNMQIPHVSDPDLTVDLSPYGEWQTSLMGLAGRDPVFFAQVQSEAWYYRDNPEAYNLLLDTCLYCHGAMGRRQWALDGHIDPELDKRKPEDFFTRELLTAYPNHPELGNRSQYGSLAREGISCMVCHTMDGDTMGVVSDGADTFFKGTSTFSFNKTGDKVFGPYPNHDIKERPMQQGLGVTPTYGKHMGKSQLCGSCHVVRLPVFEAVSGKPVKRGKNRELVVLNGRKDSSNPGTDVDGKPVLAGIRNDGLGHGDRTYEQTTYFEWQNSIYNDEEVDPLTGKQQQPKLEAQGCQDCHMPQTYHGKKLAVKIANIQDTDLADVHGRLPGEDVTLSKKQNFSRHSLNGINVFVLEMFGQFPLLLGVQQMNYQNFASVQGPFLTARQRSMDFAKHETAKLEVSKLARLDQRLNVEVTVTNLAGHFMPSGVSFRRAFLELSVFDKKNRLLWRSGQTNEVGELTDMNGRVLKTEQLDGGHQPHYQEITQPDQVQIYEEVVHNTRGHFTTSFTGIWDSVKDNRLRPKGFNNQWDNPVMKHLKAHGTHSDPDYESVDSPLWGGDRISYSIDLGKKLKKATKVTARLYYQSIPPKYLKDKFQAAKGLAEMGKDTSDIQRLYFLAGHLNTGQQNGEISPVKNWKLAVASAEKEF